MKTNSQWSSSPSWNSRTATNLIILFLITFTILQLRWVYKQHTTAGFTPDDTPIQMNFIDSNGIVHAYGRHSPLILISGYPHSGTSHLRDLLATHPQITCEAETELVELMLGWDEWLTNTTRDEYVEQEAAGIPDSLIHDAIAAMLLQIWIQNPGGGNGRQQPQHFCHHDALALGFGPHLKKVFPYIKVLFVTRDASEVWNELVDKHMQVYGLNFSAPPDANIKRIGKSTARLGNECELLGSDSCMLVEYKNLVYEPKTTMQDVWKYLGISSLE